MGQNTNSVAPYAGATLADLQEAAGVTQFPDADSWHQIINGLQVQGGKANCAPGVPLVVAFSAPYETQLLGIWLQELGVPNGGYISATGLDTFTITNGASGLNYYWWAVGV